MSKKNIFFLFLCIILGNLCATPVDFDFEGSLCISENKLIVSLGSGCDTALTLRNCGLRNAAFPFDWLVLNSHEKLILLLCDNFEFFTDKNMFSPLDDPGLSDHPNCLKNNYYDILFYHEGSVLYDWSDIEKYEEQLTQLKNKYDKRIDRFRQLRSYPGQVYFIRNFVSGSPEQANRHTELALELRDALRSFFPELDFILVIVTYIDVNAPPIDNLEGVLEFRMDRPAWQSEYKKMYNELLTNFYSWDK